MTKSERRSLDKPDETRLIPKGKIEVVNAGGATVGKVTFEPGDGFYMAPGHDGWTVGDEPFVALDFTGMADYGKSQ